MLLSRYSGQDDIVAGSPIANRQDAQSEKMIGFFVNMLVMRILVKPESSFQQLLADVRNTTLAAYERQDIPFERLVQELDRSHFEESCLAIGRGERPFVLSERLEAFLSDADHSRACRDAARIQSDVSALEREVQARR